MGARAPVEDYHHELGSASSYLEGSLHDLNADDSRQASEIDGISDVDREAVSEGSLDHDADSNTLVSFPFFFFYFECWCKLNFSSVFYDTCFRQRIGIRTAVGVWCARLLGRNEEISVRINKH